MTMTETETRPRAGILFQAELRPNRSSSPDAIRRLAMILCAVLVPAGLIFVYVGAWPVFGFLGLELVALIALLNYNHRRSYMVERIAITARDLTVERIDPWGRRRSWSFQRHWLQINVEQTADRKDFLELRSHGKALTIGSFLTPDERLEVAHKLRRALRAICAPCAPAPV